MDLSVNSRTVWTDLLTRSKSQSTLSPSPWVKTEKIALWRMIRTQDKIRIQYLCVPRSRYGSNKGYEKAGQTSAFSMPVTMASWKAILCETRLSVPIAKVLTISLKTANNCELSVQQRIDADQYSW